VYEILSGKASAKAKANKKPPAGAVQVRERAASDPTLSPHAPARRFFPKRCLKSIRPTPSQAPAKKPALAPSANPAGIKKPSPGFILKPEQSLTPLNNAQIEVRRPSRDRIPRPFSTPGFTPRLPTFPLFPRERTNREALFPAKSRNRPLCTHTSGLLSHAGTRESLSAQLYWPDDGMWYKAEVVSLNTRSRSAKVLYATGDVETLSVDEIAQEGHINVCA